MRRGAGNGGSLDKCRRRWDLADREDLRYKFMNSFDRAMNHLDKAFGFIGAPHTCAAAAGSLPAVCFARPHLYRIHRCSVSCSEA